MEPFELDLPELQLMFDVYHQQIAAGDICRTFEALMPIIGHVQIASVPKRGSPDQGDVGCRFILSHIRASAGHGS